jgi:pimeloyl-ACP methyl ester carboxylesterase
MPAQNGRLQKIFVMRTTPSPLPPALVASQRHVLAGVGGPVMLYVGDCAPATRSGRPTLLVHSVNAAASAAEVRPLFEALRDERTVCALDLPGFGHSRSQVGEIAEASSPQAWRYTVRQMTDAVAEAARWLSGHHGGGAVSVVGVSLGCEFVARAAVENPALFADLTLVSPTGLRGGQRLRGPRGSTRYVALADRVIRGPGWGPFLFRQLTRPSVIRYFLRRTWGSREIDEALWAYCCSAARQPGAEHAPLSFLSAALFSADIHDVYEAVRAPVLVVHGTRGDFTDYRGLPLPGVQRPWQVHVMQHAGALPYFERLPEFLSVWRRFAAAVDARIDDAGTAGCP